MVAPRVAVAAVICAASLSAANDAEFFESKIRPLLAANCYACHTGNALGGLRLDSRETILKGGNSGKAVVEGKPDESLLIQAVRRTHIRLKMPPVGPLAKEEVGALEEWVRQGLPWPEKKEQIAIAAASDITPEQRTFWSFQPLKRTGPPGVRNTAWPKNDIDRFILAKLEAANLTPAASADKHTWIRRVTLDLTGLPPEPADVESFAGDNSPDAKEKVVDRLIASPQYGERWARHWLDLARYSDGELAASVDTPLPNAWRYRDWVVDAFNRDLPYSTFVRAQIAADLRPELKDHLAALGFQAIGASANDQLDVTTKAFLGLTVGCAQCHNHKYDPIPTKDYYSILGIFRSTESYQYPLVPAAEVEAYKAQKKKVDALQEILNDHLPDQTKQLTDLLARDTARYLVAVWKDDKEPAGLDVETLARWKKYLADTHKEHPYLKPWYDLLATHPTEAQVLAGAQRYQQFVLNCSTRRRKLKTRIMLPSAGRRG